LCRLLLCRQVSCLCRPSASSSRFCGPHLSHHLCLPPLLMSNHAGTRVGVGFLFRRRLGTHCHASRTVRAPAAVPSLRASSPSAEPARSPRQRHKERESLTRAPSILQVGSRWHAWRVRAVPARRGRARCALRQRPPLRPRSHLPRRHFVRTSRVKRPPAARPARRQRAASRPRILALRGAALLLEVMPCRGRINEALAPRGRLGDAHSFCETCMLDRPPRSKVPPVSPAAARTARRVRRGALSPRALSPRARLSGRVAGAALQAAGVQPVHRAV